MGIILSDKGAKNFKRGGAPADTSDDMLLREIVARAPGMEAEDYQICFVRLMEEYGEDALEAIRTGHVRFEKQSTRDMEAPKPEGGHDS